MQKKNLEKNSKLTYADLVKGWKQSEELKKEKSYKSKIGSQFEYMAFIRDFFAFEKNKSQKEAIAAWNSIKLLPGKRTYKNYLKNIKHKEKSLSIKNNLLPDPTAVRVALWRALHVLKDLPPYIFKDKIALKLINPEINWQSRPDMHLENTKGFRASIVARSRFIEDIVIQKIKFGMKQYLIFGAGLDTFVQRHPELENKVAIFEIDIKETQEWKISRLKALKYTKPKNLNYISVDLSGKISWYEKLIKSKFDFKSPSITAIAGVSLYLSKEENLQLLVQFAKFPQGSIVIISFILPIELLEEKDKNNFKQVILRAKQAGTPFLSFFSPQELLTYAKNAGFKKVTHVGKKDIINLYFKNRKDDFLPSSGEEYIIACT
ncbi:class I SAM-dependent methyltransferase [Pigmentibacter sp. JX0631]|uniref:class I SAM-dependent methyltransferase n=1 Tax=Pigmentibacter sp. JX0631 TaxID=2976982 RepID=UPI0024699759|nr:class I SAM-dependent methyltransferase [Pigmentibacter sp. JX0631]WGL60688.1 class I SAM-dependent methyltransferase [Pigmentibacter sp. JX0631]